MLNLSNKNQVHLYTGNRSSNYDFLQLKTIYNNNRLSIIERTIQTIVNKIVGTNNRVYVYYLENENEKFEIAMKTTQNKIINNLICLDNEQVANNIQKQYDLLNLTGNNLRVIVKNNYNPSHFIQSKTNYYNPNIKGKNRHNFLKQNGYIRQAYNEMKENLQLFNRDREERILRIQNFTNYKSKII